MERQELQPLVPPGLATDTEHVHGPGCAQDHSPARPTAACNATRQR
jgi:hypothetical protein